MLMCHCILVCLIHSCDLCFVWSTGYVLLQIIFWKIHQHSMHNSNCSALFWLGQPNCPHFLCGTVRDAHIAIFKSVLNKNVPHAYLLCVLCVLGAWCSTIFLEPHSTLVILPQLVPLDWLSFWLNKIDYPQHLWWGIINAHQFCSFSKLHHGPHVPFTICMYCIRGINIPCYEACINDGQGEAKWYCPLQIISFSPNHPHLGSWCML